MTLITSERIIFLLDMDAFFASVEERENPSLRGRPVIVVGSASPRSVVCAANYEVRKYGVHSTMPFTQAMRLCPQAEVIAARPGLYRQVSRSIFSICETFTDLLEISSIDECYMDMTRTSARFGGPMEAGRLLKEKIREAEGLTCTIGIAPNKLLAKLAAGLKKPDGLSWITSSDVCRLFETLPLIALHGIGEKTEAKLRSMGIITAAALGSANRERLRRAFGTNGDRLIDMGQGMDDSPVVPYYARPIEKSVSHETTLEADTDDLDLLKRTLHYLSERVAYRLRKKGLSTGTVGVVARFSNLQRITRSRTISEGTDDGLAIYHAALPLLDDVMRQHKPVRLIGVAAGGLTHGIVQQGLFDDPKRKSLVSAVDSVNEKLGKIALKPASLLDAGRGDHITFKG
ncbi:MAG: DNA polymerase IV [Candidatus Marsarchaeota archaeon]|nr:DNA polymerase IV [Candidatus Marsarchaeota archaeon]